MTESRQLVIVGSGPAGLTAAIYASRAQLSPLVIEGEPSSTSDQPGGQLMLTTEVENYPGFVDGILGPELMQAFREQAARFGADYLTAKVSRVDLSSRPFGLWVGDPDAEQPSYAADSLIIATGAQSLMLNVPNEERLLGYGVSTCATCDGFFFREKEIAVVGGGDSALEEAIFLTRFADMVTVIHRRGELRASKVMQQRAFANPKIAFRWNSSVVDILGDTKVTGVRVRDNLSEEESVIESLRGLRGHRPPAQHLAVQRSDRIGGERLRAHVRRDPHQCRRGLRVWRRAGPPLPTGHHRRRFGLHGLHRRRTVARGPAGGALRPRTMRPRECPHPDGG